MQNCLRKIRKLKAWTLKELSERSGVALSTIGNFEVGRTRVSPKVLMLLAKSLQVSVEQILSDEFDFQGEGPISFSAWRSGASAVRQIPVVSWAHAGEAQDYADLCNQIDESIASNCQDEGAFALIIEGDSMEPDFYAGDRVVFSPNSEPRNGDFVVARYAEDYGVIFKKFKRTGPNGKTVVLTSLNPAYPQISRPDQDFRFIYPAVSLMRFLRR